MNVKEFLPEYKASKAEFNDYQSAVAKWEQQNGGEAEPESMLERLQRNKQVVEEREKNKERNYYKKDSDAR